MSDKRFKFGIVLSVLWVVFTVSLLICLKERTLAMTPNEWGDFLAGTCAPLAFLWLILGYLQQGEELRLNTKALELQVQELKQSVAQQQELVAVTREEMILSKQAYERENEQAVRQAQPILRLQTLSQSGGIQGGVLLRLSITNNGHTVTKIKIEPVSGMGQVEPNEFPVIARDERREFDFKCPTGLMPDAQLYIHFLDGQGILRHHAVLMLKNEKNGLISPLLPEEIFLTDV